MTNDERSEHWRAYAVWTRRRSMSINFSGGTDFYMLTHKRTLVSGACSWKIANIIEEKKNGRKVTRSGLFCAWRILIRKTIFDKGVVW